MTSKEFVLWLKGFTEGVHEYSISPKQWDTLKDKLATVKDEPTLTVSSSYPSGSSGTIIATPGYGSITYKPATSTTYGYPSGSAWHYTNNTYNPPYTTGGEADYITKETHNED
jgi:hypothetical protein